MFMNFFSKSILVLSEKYLFGVNIDNVSINDKSTLILGFNSSNLLRALEASVRVLEVSGRTPSL